MIYRDSGKLEFIAPSVESIFTNDYRHSAPTLMFKQAKRISKSAHPLIPIQPKKIHPQMSLSKHNVYPV